MGGSFIQSGSLTGAVGSQGTLQANVAAQAELKATIASEGTLQATVAAEETLQATIEPEETLNGTIYMPKEKEVLKLANAPKVDDVTLLADAWVSGEDKRHSQVVEIASATNKSQVDLTPDDEQLLVFYKKDITFVTKNEGGVVTVIVIGQKPTNDYTIQVTLTELDVPDGTTIWGITVGTTISPESISEKLDIEPTRPLTNIEIEKLINNFT